MLHLRLGQLDVHMQEMVCSLFVAFGQNHYKDLRLCWDVTCTGKPSLLRFASVLVKFV